MGGRIAESLAEGGESARWNGDEYAREQREGGRAHGGAALRLKDLALGRSLNPGQMSSVGLPSSLKICRKRISEVGEPGEG